MILGSTQSSTQIIEGAINQVNDLACNSSNILLITTKGFKDRGLISILLSTLDGKNVHIMEDVKPNPSIDFVNSLIKKYFDYQFDCIIAIGGGSVLDVGKIMRVSLGGSKPYVLNSSDTNFSTLTKNSKIISLIAVPTTSGSGAEVTPFSTIWDAVGQKKYSWYSENLNPDIALLAPELVRSLPKIQTIYTGLDCISHALESIWNRNVTDKSRKFAIESLKITSKYFLRTIEDLTNINYRKKMQLASTMAGLAIGTTKTAIAHSISYPLTAKLGIPHGLAASFTLEKILQDHQSKFSQNEVEFELYSEIMCILRKLNLKMEINKYASNQQILELSIEMQNKERFQNFSGFDYDIKKLLIASLSS